MLQERQFQSAAKEGRRHSEGEQTAKESDAAGYNVQKCSRLGGIS